MSVNYSPSGSGDSSGYDRPPMPMQLGITSMSTPSLRRGPSGALLVGSQTPPPQTPAAVPQTSPRSKPSYSPPPVPLSGPSPSPDGLPVSPRAAMDAALAVYGSRFPAETDAVFARRLLDQMKAELDASTAANEALVMQLKEAETELSDLKTQLISMAANTSPPMPRQAPPGTPLATPNATLRNAASVMGALNRGSGFVQDDDEDTSDALPMYNVEKMEAAREIMLNKSKSRDKLHVLGGTVDKLVDLLAASSFQDVEFREAFLLTYRTFVTPTVLLDMISQRLFVDSADPQFAKHKRYIELRLLTILKTWIDRAAHDFEDEELSTRMADFLKRLGTMDAVLAKEARDILSSKKAPYSYSILEGQIMTSPTLSRTRSDITIPPDAFLAFDELDIAQQLTQVTYELFMSISPIEFLNKVWQKQEPTVGLTRMIQRFNVLSSYFVYEIVHHEKLAVRQSALKRVIRIAQLCKELQNFECVVAILIALQSASVGRLKQTWKAVLMDAKVNMVYNELSVLMSPDGNYAQYRTLIQHTSPPAIPYMGLYLRDLLFIDEGNKNFCDPARTMINFAKRKLVASLLMEIQKWRTIPYRYEVDPFVSQWLLDLKVLNQDKLYELSVATEPSSRKT